MKRSILHIYILLSAVFLCNTKMLAWGENVSYLLNSTTEYSMSTGISDFGGRAGETFAFDAPMARVEFEAKKSALSVSGFYVQISTDGNVWSDLSGELSLSTSFKSFSFDITDANARFIRFYAKTGATLTKTYRNIKVVRATSISAPTYVNMGEVTIGKSVSTTIKVQYNNTTYPQQITASCSNPAFTVTPVSVGEYGTAELTVTFAPTMAGSFSDGVTLTMGNATTMFTVSGTATTDRSTPSFTWLLTSASTGQEYHDFFKTTNPDCPYIITSSDESIAKVVDGVLETYKEGICQHYASSATVLFRALGIPARYTIGYTTHATANEWVEVTTENAHAWVEVYIDGVGWIYSEGDFRQAVIDNATGNDFIYPFAQWSSAGGQTLPGLVKRRLIEADMYLNGSYAHACPASYTYVLYNNNGGEGQAKVHGYDSSLQAYVRSVPARSGYVFLGWYTAAEGGASAEI